MRHLDLFSGIGGFALAAQSVWRDDYQNIAFCEIDPFCQAVLQKHWPDANIYGDIRTLTADAKSERCAEAWKHSERPTQWPSGSDTPQIDLLTGGFPCQPFSSAGRRRGTADDRYLWPEMLRVIREFHPRWIIGENVGGFVTWNEGMVLEQVHVDLENEGYEVQAFIIPSAGINAPHRRDRIWIVAHSEYAGSQERRLKDNSEMARGDDVRKTSRHISSKTSQSNRDASNSANKRNEWRRQTRQRRNGLTNQSWNQNWSEVAARLCRMDDGVSGRLDRTPRLKALGNAIVPQVAAEIMSAIAQTEANLLNEN